MALEDIKTKIDGTEYTTFYWYYNLNSTVNKKVDGAYNDFGEGKSNTITIIDIWNNKPTIYGEQNTRDLWGVIQNIEKYSIVENENDTGKWFVPSKSELSAFEDYLYEELGIIVNENGDYGLNKIYWSSSQSSSSSAFELNLYNTSILVYGVQGEFSVRLSATF